MIFMNYKFNKSLVGLMLFSVVGCAENAILPIANDTNRESFLSARNQEESAVKQSSSQSQAGMEVLSQVDKRGALVQSGSSRAKARGKSDAEVNQAGRAGIDRLIVDTRENNTVFTSKTVKETEARRDISGNGKANTGLTHLQQDADESFVTYLSKTVGLTETAETNSPAENSVYLSKTAAADLGLAAPIANQAQGSVEEKPSESSGFQFLTKRSGSVAPAPAKVATGSTGCFTIFWYTPSQPIKEYILRYGFVKDQLDNVVTIEISKLTKKQDAKRGSFYEYQLLCGSLNSELFFTISAKNDFGNSPVTKIMTVRK
jgi:hypothetical protein